MTGGRGAPETLTGYRPTMATTDHQATMRHHCPRRSHGDWAPSPERRDPLAILSDQERDRVPELIPLRHERMAASPFAFFRGAAAIMAADLADTPTTGLVVQACGDAHLSNFGAYAAPDRRLVFDLNDFDETLTAPWEWDVKRLAASVAIIGRERGFTTATRADLVLAAVGGYRTAMRSLAGMTNLAVWYARVELEQALATVRAETSKADRRQQAAALAKARKRDNLRALKRLAEPGPHGTYRFRNEPPLLVPSRSLPPLADGRRPEWVVHSVLDIYRDSLPTDRQWLFDQYGYVDIARKVVGVGSVGTRAFVVMFDGHDGTDPLFLQVKQAQQSVLEPYAGASPFATAGQRVVEGQRMMQSASDIFLGWCSAPDPDGRQVDYYVRQLWDWKASVDLDNLGAAGFAAYTQLCGRTLARAHARSGDRKAIGRYLGSGTVFDQALVTFAERYADQNEADHAALVAAIAAGQVSSEPEPDAKA